MPRPHTDIYANLATIRVTESGANTLTFVELLTGISLGQGIGLLIDSLEYHLDAGVLADMAAAGDAFTMALCTNQTMTSLNPENPGLVHTTRIQMDGVIGTPASSGKFSISPIVYQFFPSIIIAAPRVYAAAAGISLASAGGFRMRIYFRYITLSSQEYLELAETFLLVG